MGGGEMQSFFVEGLVDLGFDLAGGDEAFLGE